jgi:GNAT superfamily N-acetyltransferase
MTIGRIRRDDWPAFWPMLIAMGTDDPEPTARSRFHTLLQDPLWAIFVAEDEGVLLGYAAAQDRGTHLRYGDAHRMARLHDLFVVESRRHGGVGRALLEDVRRWAATRVRYLEWQAHESRSAPFYERLGYQGAACLQPDYPTFVIDFEQPQT